MASFKKFLTYTALTAAAVAGGIAIYKKFQGNSVDCDDDFDDFDDDDFDDDFDDLDVDCRNYTSISADNAAEEATEEVSE
ncbi:MAG: hypothetical protein UEA60_05630 [Lachnospiraceae bacterium]|nr:hypothetical protein [Lachnospiraceae bacterium]MEE0686119.1 hypothetical protein [Lachnospiraceae bacterium]MEE0861867.1 hypothetical protein [Lachnospiraceae bacterium]